MYNKDNDFTLSLLGVINFDFLSSFSHQRYIIQLGEFGN